MTEWNQPQGGSPPTLEEVLEKIRQQFKRFKGGPALILTAIVVGIATTALGLALVVRIQEAYGSIEEHEIQDQDTQDQMESRLEAYGFRKKHVLSVQNLEE